jgi:hypothetical protein
MDEMFNIAVTQAETSKIFTWASYREWQSANPRLSYHAAD